MFYLVVSKWNSLELVRLVRLVTISWGCKGLGGLKLEAIRKLGEANKLANKN